tara:strand:- start:868 stop:1044 length:177 start_codon:yes stop_codon:yes gene_type:complete
MSTLHHESLLETCFDQAWEDMRVEYKLTHEQMERMATDAGIQVALEQNAVKLFEEMGQ